jgi:hypothetical protein
MGTHQGHWVDQAPSSVSVGSSVFPDEFIRDVHAVFDAGVRGSPGGASDTGTVQLCGRERDQRWQMVD